MPSVETSSDVFKPISAPPPDAPDFLVVGMQKSGTHWLTATLNAHPEIRCFPSKPKQVGGDGSPPAHFFDVLARMQRGDYMGFAKSMRTKLNGHFEPVVPLEPPVSEEEARALVRRLRDRFGEYFTEQRRLHGKPLVGEKTAETVHHLDLVEALFPGVKKICILRDPRDRAVSFHFQQILKGRKPEGPIDQAHCDAYIEHVERDYRGLLQIEEPYYLLTYEQMHRDPESVLAPLLEFIGVELPEGGIQALLEESDFRKLASRQKGEEDRGSYYRKGVAGDWRNHLTPELSRHIVDSLAPLTDAIEERLGLDLAEYRVV